MVHKRHKTSLRFSEAASSGVPARFLGLPDIIATSPSVIFCGINPGVRSATVGLHFANRSNRFWRVLYLAGFTDRQLEPEEARLLLDRGYGITSAVARPTASATDLTRADFIAGRPAFERKIAKYSPRYLAFLGKPAPSVLLNQRNLSWGLQATKFGWGGRVGFAQSERPESRVHDREIDGRLSGTV